MRKGSNSVRGIDVSKHNGSIDFNALKKDNIEFVVLRSGYGTVKDTKFDTYINLARKAELYVLAYHFSYALNPQQAIAEADFCYSVIKNYKVDMVFFDYEEDSERYSKEQNVTPTLRSRTDIAKAFCNQMRMYGYDVGIYTNPDYLKNKFITYELSSWKLWLARWISNGVVSFNTVNADKVDLSYGKPIIWQFGKGYVQGIKGYVDLNYGYFDLPKKETVPPPVVKPPVDDTLKKGDYVILINTTTSNGKIYGKTYTGGTFRVYPKDKKYRVISAKGHRICIGTNLLIITSAVNKNDLKRV